MSPTQRGRSSNPLIARVNQHRALAVLFRAPQDERSAQATSVQRSAWVLGRLLDQPVASVSVDRDVREPRNGRDHLRFAPTGRGRDESTRPNAKKRELGIREVARDAKGTNSVHSRLSRQV